MHPSSFSTFSRRAKNRFPPAKIRSRNRRCTAPAIIPSSSRRRYFVTSKRFCVPSFPARSFVHSSFCFLLRLFSVSATITKLKNDDVDHDKNFPVSPSLYYYVHVSWVHVMCDDFALFSSAVNQNAGGNPV